MGLVGLWKEPVSGVGSEHTSKRPQSFFCPKILGARPAGPSPSPSCGSCLVIGVISGTWDSAFDF